MANQIKCYGNNCPDRHNCQRYSTEAEKTKTDPDDNPDTECELFKQKGAEQ